VLIIVALATFFFTVFKDCGNKNKTISNAADAIEEVTTDVGDAMGEAADSLAGMADDVFDDDDVDQADADGREDADSRRGDTIDPENDADDGGRETVNGRNSGREDDVASRMDSRAGSSWNYLVIVGSYNQERWAKAEEARLRKEGFSNMEVVVFDLSQYYTLIAGRYGSLRDARQMENKLKAAGLNEVYVQKKRSKRS
ncbi:MAG: SPOR domain-containing protein, partial [Bacteroidota bacterium]